MTQNDDQTIYHRAAAPPVSGIATTRSGRRALAESAFSRPTSATEARRRSASPEAPTTRYAADEGEALSEPGALDEVR
jgi:hypothetical protein